MSEPIKPNAAQMASPSYRMAAMDQDFLLGDSMRGVRFLMEYAKPEEALRAWGVRSTLVEHVAHTDLMFIQVDEFFLGQGLAKEGDKVVVISGSPPGIIGSTNDIRIHKIGDAVNGNAPIYQSEK